MMMMMSLLLWCYFKTHRRKISQKFHFPFTNFLHERTRWLATHERKGKEKHRTPEKSNFHDCKKKKKRNAKNIQLP